MAKNAKIAPHIKSSVLLELSAEDYSIAKIAEFYGISRAVIYGWIKELQAAKTVAISDTNSSFKNNFIEVALIDDNKKSLNYQSSSLQKASLEFDDFSLKIEGNIRVSKFLKIVQKLEEIC